MDSQTSGPPVPKSFLEFVKAFGPGIIVVLTWLGAGDIVDMGVAGSNYGYSLLWVLVIAVMMRFVLVSLIGRYQLCNQHGEGLLDGLVRFHPLYAPVLFFGSIGMGHFYLSYMVVGVGEVSRNVTGLGDVWMWSTLWNAVAVFLIFKGGYNSLENVFKLFLGLLSISFVGSAIWVGFDGLEVLRGLYRMEMPGHVGNFSPVTVGLAMIGAVGGSFMNLVYPYFLEQKGWRGPKYRKIQVYDLLLGIIAMIILNVAIWILGAELLYPDRQISNLDDLPNLLSDVLGGGGRLLFYLGVFSAVYTSVVGHAVGLGSLGSHSFFLWKKKPGSTPETRMAHPTYRYIVLWCLISPLVWTLPGMPDFVTLTLVANSAQVILVPLVAGGVWRITAGSRFIGEEYKNRWWENAVMALLFALAVYGGFRSGAQLLQDIQAF